MSDILDVSTARLSGPAKRVVDDRLAELEEEIARLHRENADLKRQVRDVVTYAFQKFGQIHVRANRMTMQPDYKHGTETHAGEIVHIVEEAGYEKDERVTAKSTDLAVFQRTGKFPPGAIKDKTGVGPPRAPSPPCVPVRN